jgi:hypothetical protein
MCASLSDTLALAARMLRRSSGSCDRECIRLHGAQLLLEVIVTITKRKFCFVGNSRKIASIERAAQEICAMTVA